VHFALGLAAGALTRPAPLLALAIYVAYLAYQLIEREPLQETYNDLTEALSGYALGLILSFALIPSLAP